MLPRTSVALQGFWIERKTDVSGVSVVVPVRGEIVPFVVSIDETTDTSCCRIRRAEVGAV
jgi:hypothetical protein